MQFQNDWRITANANVAFRSKYTLEADLDPASVEKAWAKLDMRLEIASPDALWRFAVYARNLTNVRTSSFTYIWPFPRLTG